MTRKKRKMIIENNDEAIRKLLEEPVTKGVTAHFDEICSIPHSSGHEKALADRLRTFLESAGCTARTDASGNVSAYLPASQGYENAPLLMFQGHLDMVCAVGDGSGYDPLTDSIELLAGRDIDGTPILHTSGRSSLGADDGIGLAAVLWLFDRAADGGIRAAKHGPLKVLMTVREEQGLHGAESTRKSLFDDVDFLVNIDGFTAGRFITASAGGRREVFERASESVPTGRIVSGADTGAASAFEIRIRGLLGGHSGFDINKKRINGAAFICRLLADIRDAGVDYALCSLDSGMAHNVIPSSADAVIVFEKGQEELVRDVARMTLAAAKADAADDEGDFEILEVPVPELAVSRTIRDGILDFVNSTTVGVVKYMEHFKDIVDTSCNLGRIWAAPDRETAHVMFFERSIDRKAHDAVIKEHADAAEKTGFNLIVVDEYGSWEFDGRNPLLDAALAAYEEATGEKGEPYAVHIGIEPSVFYGDNPKMYMVSSGMNVHDPHTVNERCDIETIAPFANTLLNLTARVADMKKEPQR